MNDSYIESITLEGMHQRYDLKLKFNKSLNVLYGQNGTGKSTLIHILANLANGDFLRFAYLDFISINVGYSNDKHVRITCDGESDPKYEVTVNSTDDDTAYYFVFFQSEAKIALLHSDEERNSKEQSHEVTIRQKYFVDGSGLPKMKTAYFPAFRTMLEAWSSQFEDEIRRYRGPGVTSMSIHKVTGFARNLFGKFLPTINYPSPLSIEQNLKEEIRDAHLKIARYESSIFSDSFVKVFSAILSGAEGTIQEAEKLLEEISELTNETAFTKLINFEGPSHAYVQLQNLVGRSRESRELASSATGALTVYRDALRERRDYQVHIFAKIDKYFAAVNAFLDQKELRYLPDSSRRIPRVGLQFPDGSWSSIRVMSSGERQLLTMLYAVTKMSTDSLVLIDEPELSLHIDWQEDLLGKMMAQMGGRQIIVCTHSPSIASDYREFMIEVAPNLTQKPVASDIMTDDDEELI